MNMKRLEAFVIDKMSASGLPGLSLALVKDGAVVYARGFGQRDVISGFPATPDTLYSVGSVTKSFTVIAILQLVEAGQLDLDEPISQYVAFNLKPFDEDIRIKDLLSHTTGIPALAYAEALLRHISGTGGKALAIAGPEDIINFANEAASWVETRPGERWFYFNEGYAMLGQIIERVTGQAYNKVIQDKILAPLGMTRSFFTRADVEAADDVAVPYVVHPDKEPTPGRYLYRSIRSEGGLISSVMDLSKAILMYLKGGETVLSQPFLEAMWQPHIPMPWQLNPSLFADGGETGPASHYGYGLAVEDFYGEPLVGHGGSVGVATAQLGFLPERGAGVALLTNGSGYPTAQFAKVALACLLEKDIEALPFIATEKHLEALVGRYETYKGTMSASVHREADFLILTVHGGSQPQRTILVPERLAEGQADFYTLTGGRRLAVSFRKSQAGLELIFERYKFKRTGTL